MPARTFLAAALTAVLSLLAAAPADAASYRLSVVQTPDGAQVARWDPCETISWKVNVGGARDREARRKAIAVAKRAVGRLGSLTGLSFSFAGGTREIPRRGTLAGQSADLVVAFVRPDQTDHPLAGSTAGYGGWRGEYELHEGAWHLAITKGFVVIDHPQTRRWADRLDRRGVTRANLLGHELAHAIGLEHVRDRTQLMHHVLHPASPAGYAAGDRRGLARIGAAAGCIGG